MYVSHLCSVPPPTFTYQTLVPCYHIHRISISYTTTFVSGLRCRSCRGEKTAVELLLGGRQCLHVHHMPLIPIKSHDRSLSCVRCANLYSVDQLHHMHSCSDPIEATTSDRHTPRIAAFFTFSFTGWLVKPTTQHRLTLYTHIYYDCGHPNKKVDSVLLECQQSERCR